MAIEENKIVKENEYTAGGKLMRARVRKKWDIAKVADKLKISTSSIQAIENGDFEKLPEVPYAIGFIRSYANLVQLKPESMIEEYKIINGHKKTKHYLPQAEEIRSKFHYIYVIIGLVLITAIIWISTNTLLINKKLSDESGKVNIPAQSVEDSTPVTSEVTKKKGLTEIKVLKKTTNFTSSVMKKSNARILGDDNNTTIIATQPALGNETFITIKTPPEPLKKTVATKTALKSKKIEPSAKEKRKKYITKALNSHTVIITAKRNTHVRIISPTHSDKFNGSLNPNQNITVPLNKFYSITANEPKNIIITLVDKNNKRYTFKNFNKSFNNDLLNKNEIKKFLK